MKLLATLFLLLVLSLPNVHAGDKPVRGALCLIRADHQLLLVQEVMTNKLSLPGGTIEKGEPPELAAERETWEETGLKVSADRLLGMTDSAYVFNCALQEQLTAYQYQDASHYRTVPLWAFPHYGVEVRRVLLVAPEFVQAAQYRYPQQWNGIVKDFFKATEQTARYIENLTHQASTIEQKQLYFLAQLQSLIDKSFTDNQILWLQIADSLSGIAVFSLIIAITLQFFGFAFTLRLMLICSVSVGFVVVSRSYFALARPFEYLPSVRLGNSFGFSVPDLTVVIAVVISLLVLKRVSPNKGSGQGMVAARSCKFLLFAVFATYGVLQFSLGNQFISGMLISLLVGYLIVTIFSFAGQRLLKGSEYQSNPLLWVFIASFSAAFTYHSYNVEMAYICLSALTLAILLYATKSPRVVHFSLSRAFTASVLIIALHLAVNSVTKMVSYSGFYSSLAELSYAPLLTYLIWLILVRKPSSEQTSR
ncbi:NUDIX domain-containing protein [Vibrio sp. SCSIO 43137]|uniref:NUDIX domain-containing protein n=1 Tax=Vibrio sp. SCSIO 43137 TaxID=3021011 RepID=UPI002306F833|nr:NUDIX domain-containing protein [Vibrio sp. SCSIO 43137]WCE31162.1 NUDIX domain-containing protein [Vibrio sp. SCSIO 43137]